MGCLKLDILEKDYTIFEVYKNTEKNLLTSKKSDLFSRRRYVFGFNGMEKDDEVKGAGNHLSFGDYGLDVRTGRRWNIDPLSIKFPYESNYSYVSNNPVIYRDADGQKKTIYLKYINEMTGETKIFEKVVSNELLHVIPHYTIHTTRKKAKHKNPDKWTTVHYEWYDINQFNTLILRKDGTLEFIEGGEEIGEHRTTTNSMSQGWANFKLKIQKFFNQGERGKQGGGYALVSKYSNNGDGPKIDATKEIPKVLNIDILMILGELGGRPEYGDILNWVDFIDKVKDISLEIKEIQDGGHEVPIERISYEWKKTVEKKYMIYESTYSDGSKKLDTLDYLGSPNSQQDNYDTGRQTKRDAGIGVTIKE